MKIYNLFFLVAFLFLSQPVSAQKTAEALGQRIANWESVASVIALKPEKGYQSGYEIEFTQPLDHNKPNGETFTQRVYLSHLDLSKPMVIVTEGYASHRNYIAEITGILGANQLVVEHRFFGESTPEGMDWDYLNIRQAAADHHRIIEQFKSLYKGKWVSTGISKSGSTALYLKYLYRDDVDVSVPYVAPINTAEEDPRIYEFLNSVGDETCRKNIHDFQRRLLENKDKLMPLVKWYNAGAGAQFSIGLETAFEYAVLEYSFSFWQMGHDCEKIPGPDASIDDLMTHLVDVVGFSLYTDKGIAYYAPHFHQAMGEAGYYGFQTKGFEDLLTLKNPTNRTFAPKEGLSEFKPELINEIKNWLEKKGDRIIYIYGELDTWSATAVNPSKKVDALRIMMPGRSHGDARISNMSDEEKHAVFSKLEKWLGVRIVR